MPIKFYLIKYKIGNYKYRFLVYGLLFSSGIKNDASILFITSNGSNSAQYSIINGEIYKLLDVVHVQQISNWSKLKGILNWTNSILTDSDEPINSDHFGFAFEKEIQTIC